MRGSRPMFLALTFVIATGIGVEPAHADAIIPVRALYLVPADRAANPEYTAAIEMALLDLQSWYADQLGGFTFALTSPSVDVVSTTHPAAYYSTAPNPFPDTNYDFFFNVLDEATGLGVQVNDPAYRWAIYIDSDPGPGQQGGAALGALTIIGAPDLRGLIGQEPQPVSRWIGGLGHELGHTFGLPHPSDCVGPTTSCVYGPLDYSSDVVGGALMQFGYLTYPNTYLLSEEKQFLLATPYFGPVDTTTATVSEPGTLGLLLAAALAASNGRRRVVRPTPRRIYVLVDRQPGVL